MSKETDNSEVKSPIWQSTEIKEDMLTFSPQICLEDQEQSAISSAESLMPQLGASSRECCLKGKIKTRPKTHEKE